jgi:hypothetical protein
MARTFHEHVLASTAQQDGASLGVVAVLDKGKVFVSHLRYTTREWQLYKRADIAKVAS